MLEKKILLAFIVFIFGLGFFKKFMFLPIPQNQKIRAITPLKHQKRANFQDPGEKIYKAKCNMCHNGAVAEAPRLEAMQLLSVDAIVESLENGVMKIQGASLTKEERRLVAQYISKIDKKEKDIITGQCEQSQNRKTNSKVLISDWGMGLNNGRYSNSKDLQINADNVSQLSLSWVFAFPEATRARSQPTIAGNTLFTASQHGLIYALDIATGCTRWTFQAETEVRSAIIIGTDKDGNADRLYFGDFKANVYALDLKTRKLLWKKRVDIHEQATITGSPVYHQGRLYVPVSSTEVVSAYNPKYPCCTFRGSVVALNVVNGEQIWKSYMTDEPMAQGFNAEGVQKYAPSGVPIWSSPTIDTKRGLLYIGTGENYTRPSTSTSDAIIALSLETGAIKWIQQTLSQDAWNGGCTEPKTANCPENHGPDYDFGAPPILISRIAKPDVILAGQKSGLVYALDPESGGKLIWQQKVGRGGIMGGIHWGMASNNEILYVPINDQSAWPEDRDKPALPGLHALDINTGQILWSKIEPDKCEKVDWVCSPGLSAAITLIPGVVFAGSLDGVLHAYSSKDGKTLWEYDTKRDYKAVNGQKAYGGTIDSAGPVIVANRLFINSGYAKFGEKAGNVLLCFEIQKEKK